MNWNPAGSIRRDRIYDSSQFHRIAFPVRTEPTGSPPLIASFRIGTAGHAKISPPLRFEQTPGRCTWSRERESRSEATLCYSTRHNPGRKLRWCSNGLAVGFIFINRIRLASAQSFGSTRPRHQGARARPGKAAQACPVGASSGGYGVLGCCRVRTAAGQFHFFGDRLHP